MQGFRQSRGRIFFDTLCAFGMSASCALAWMQTYADALLGAAGIAGLYGLVRFSDMFRREPVADEAVELQPAVEVETHPAAEPTPVVAVERKSVELAGATPELKPEVVAALVRKPKRKPAKKSAKAEEPVELPRGFAPAEVAKADPEQPAAVDPEPDYSTPIAPLFEPEPFVRQQQRAAFGRKFGAR
jgi:hypothetical protein